MTMSGLALVVTAGRAAAGNQKDSHPPRPRKPASASAGTLGARDQVQSAGPGLRKGLQRSAFGPISIGPQFVEDAAYQAKMH